MTPIGPEPREWNEEVDVAVFGSGAGGMSAALACAIEGLSVALYEKSQYIGGTTANSGGAVWVPGSTRAENAGVADSIDNAYIYLESELGAYFQPPYIEAYLRSGAAALDYFSDHSEVKFELGDYPDYHPEAPGGVITGRTLLPLPFDARKLGADFAILRPPWQRFMVLGGMMIGRREIPTLLHPFSSVGTFWTVLRMIGRYAVDRLHFPRGTRLLIGNALAARFLFSLRQKRVAIHLNSRLQSLVCGTRGVEGAIVLGSSGAYRVKARMGVVLATGGFPHNAEMRASLAPYHPHSYSAGFEGNTGDGMSIAAEAGAAIDRKMANPCFWTPASILQEKDGTQTVFPYGYLDRGKPGAIIINSRGKRFVNEADSYHDVVTAMFEGPDKNANLRSHLICDQRFIRKYGLGAIHPGSRALQDFVKTGYVLTGKSIAELATRIAVDPSTLEETIRQHNQYAVTGVDLEFGKGNSAFNKFNGDPDCKPNSCLRPIAEGPFYALRIFPASLGTCMGIKTDPDARVIATNGAPISGLYACGNDMGSIMRGHYPGAGITLGPAIVFGYRAAQHLAALGGRGSAPDEATAARVCGSVQLNSQFLDGAAHTQ